MIHKLRKIHPCAIALVMCAASLIFLRAIDTAPIDSYLYGLDLFALGAIGHTILFMPPILLLAALIHRDEITRVFLTIVFPLIYLVTLVSFIIVCFVCFGAEPELYPLNETYGFAVFC